MQEDSGTASSPTEELMQSCLHTSKSNTILLTLRYKHRMRMEQPVLQEVRQWTAHRRLCCKTLNDADRDVVWERPPGGEVDVSSSITFVFSQVCAGQRLKAERQTCQTQNKDFRASEWSRHPDWTSHHPRAVFCLSSLCKVDLSDETWRPVLLLFLS